LLLVVSRLRQPANVYNVLKCLWFADRDHLERFGRQIYGETYFAPEHGPVPSGAYDIVKYVAGRLKLWDLHFPEALECVEANATEIAAKRRPDLDLLSKSEIACLTEAARKYGGLSFRELKALSHQSEAFKNADLNGEISLTDVVNELPSGQAVLEHMADRHPGSAEDPAA
jgi:uncharacterized phage-associated protein